MELSCERSRERKLRGYILLSTCLLNTCIMLRQPLTEFGVRSRVHLFQIDPFGYVEHKAVHEMFAKCRQAFIFSQFPKQLVHLCQLFINLGIDFSPFRCLHGDTLRLGKNLSSQEFEHICFSE